MYGCENWTINKAEHWRIDAFRLWCWKRFLGVPTARRSNQPIFKEINPEYSLEGLMLKLKLQTLVTWCEEPTCWKKPRCWERLKAKGEWGQQRTRCLDSITDSTYVNLSKLWEIMEDRGAWRAAVHGVAKSQTWLSNWATTRSRKTNYLCDSCCISFGQCWSNRHLHCFEHIIIDWIHRRRWAGSL